MNQTMNMGPLVCNCSLVGTDACKSCSRYTEYFGNSEITIAFPQFALQGWQCPICKVVHAPWILRCDCATLDKEAQCENIGGADTWSK